MDVKSNEIISLVEYLYDKGFEEASVLAVNATGKRYSISKTGMNVSDDPMLCTRGFMIRVTQGNKWAEHSCNTLNSEDFDKISQNLQELISLNDNATACERISVENENDGAYFTKYEIHPTEVGDEGILNCLEKVRNKTLACDERLMDCNVFCTYADTAKLFVKKAGGQLVQKEQRVLWMTGFISVMASRGDEIKDYYKTYSNLGGAEVLREMENDCQSIADSVVALLDSKQIEPGEYECICAPDVTGIIVHEAFGHGVEMDMFVKKRALAEEYVGKYVASPLVTMHDGARAAEQTATYFFDDEGDDAPDNVFIDGQQQHGSHRETVEHKAGDHDDPGPVDTGIDNFGMQNPEKTAQGKQRYLEAEKFHGQAGGRNACRHPPFFEGKHLHGLAAGSSGGDAGIEHADDGYQQGGTELDFYVLLPEKNMHTHRFKNQKNAIGNNGCPDPV